MMRTSIILEDGVKDKLRQFGSRFPKALDKVLYRVGTQYRAELKKKYLSGQMLGRRSGQLIKSLYVARAKGEKHCYVVGQKTITERQDFGGVVLVRSSSESLKLANIYEHSGGYTIVPKKAKALVFVAPDGKIVFTKRVQGRERPFMSTSAQRFNWVQAFEKTTDKIVAEEAKLSGMEVVR